MNGTFPDTASLVPEGLNSQLTLAERQSASMMFQSQQIHIHGQLQMQPFVEQMEISDFQSDICFDDHGNHFLCLAGSDGRGGPLAEAVAGSWEPDSDFEGAYRISSEIDEGHVMNYVNHKSIKKEDGHSYANGCNSRCRTREHKVTPEGTAHRVSNENEGRRGAFRKRKDGKMHAVNGRTKVHRISSGKECGEIKNQSRSISASVRSNITQKEKSSKKEYSAEASNETCKETEVQTTDYIHVRARRGQATDSHSLAERVRREKISERMKCLQNMVPGCNKVTGKAGMLDEIINYVQSLQRQVEFLSMKLATVSPVMNLDVYNLYSKEGLLVPPSDFAAVGLYHEAKNNDYNIQSFVKQEPIAGGDLGIERISNTTNSISESFADPYYLYALQLAASWDTEMRNLNVIDLEQHGGSTSELFSASYGNANVKMEM